MMKVIIFSHESDLDGLYSAAIGLMRYPQAMTVFLGTVLKISVNLETLFTLQLDPLRRLSVDR